MRETATGSILSLMTKTEYARACDISDRRLAALRANGEDTRNTVAWRDACSERSMINLYNYLNGK